MAENTNADSASIFFFLLTLAILHESGMSPKKDANKARLQITILVKYCTRKLELWRTFRHLLCLFHEFAPDWLVTLINPQLIKLIK